MAKVTNLDDYRIPDAPKGCFQCDSPTCGGECIIPALQAQLKRVQAGASIPPWTTREATEQDLADRIDRAETEALKRKFPA